MQDDTSNMTARAMICDRSLCTFAGSEALHLNNALENLQQVEEDAARESLQNYAGGQDGRCDDQVRYTMAKATTKKPAARKTAAKKKTARKPAKAAKRTTAKKTAAKKPAKRKTAAKRKPAARKAA